LHNTNPLYSLLVAKYSVKKIISEKIGNQYIIPIIGVWNKFEEIDFNTLPEQFVLKTTHDSGNVFICKDKNKIDINYLKVRINKALKLNYFYKSREYPYKKVVPRIMAEKYMDDNTQEELTDYKFFCFHGEPKIVQISSGKGAKKRIGFYDMDFNLLPLSTDANIADLSLEKPNNFDQMVEISKTLSCDMIHVRIDLYLINQQIYFGEYTFHNNGGIVHFSPPEWNTTLGDMINLPIV
ncbi:MAG: ATP-grasp fold amidoligase family protein, partial [Salinivirgaceae bacterium]|nr:ATP-grasp fold amidoligase family protein [Salinivirgaceae bacterium]